VGATALFCTAILSVGLAPRAAFAAKAAAKAGVGDELAREATRRFKEGEYDMAAQLFMKAYALDKRPDRVFNAARAYEKAAKPQEAIALFRLYRQITDDEAGRQESQLRIEALEAQLRAKSLEAGPLPAAGERPSPPSEPAVGLPAAASVSQLPPVAPSLPGPVANQRVAAPTPARWPTAAAFGVAGVAALASAGLYVWARNDEADLDQALQQRDANGRVTGISQADAEDLRLRQGSLRTWSAVGAGAAAAALLVGVWWWRSGAAEVQVGASGAAVAVRF
jgi:tetratricopeptide (TPR) repeat protein